MTKQRPEARTVEDTEDSTLIESARKPEEHVSASGDDETEDGLNELDEETRRGAEDIPALETKEDVPVFDRAEQSRDE